MLSHGTFRLNSRAPLRWAVSGPLTGTARAVRRAVRRSVQFVFTHPPTPLGSETVGSSVLCCLPLPKRNLPFGDMECRLERTAGRCPTSCTLRRPSVPKQFPQPNAFLGSRGVCSLVKAYWICGLVIRTVPIGSNQDVKDLVRACVR